MPQAASVQIPAVQHAPRVVHGVTRETLIDTWIDNASMADLLDVLNEMGLMEINALKRMIVATAQGVSLGNVKNQERLMASAALFCALLRNQVDVMHGERLQQSYDEATAEDSALRGLKCWARG